MKLPHGYGLTFRVLWQNGDTMEVEIPLYADGYNQVIDPLIFGKQALTQLLKRINELEGRFLGKEADEKNKGGSAIAELKEWKNTLDFSLSDAERLKVERLNKPKIPIKRIEIDMEGRHFFRLLHLPNGNASRKPPKSLKMRGRCSD